MIANSANTEWNLILGEVLSRGNTSDPRGQSTFEMLGSQTRIDMKKPVITSVARKLNYRFMCAEAYWILSGDGTTSIGKYMSRWLKYSDSGHWLQGAYGPKVMEQMQYVFETLLQDPSSRQAVISIWREMPRPSKDIPCTLSLQFLIRENKLHCICSMRSSDLWLGYPYDVFNFSMIALHLLLRFRGTEITPLDLGMLQLTAGSQHIYQHDVPRVQEVIQDKSDRENLTIDTHKVLSPDHLLSCLCDARNGLCGQLSQPFFRNLSSWSAKQSSK